MATRLRGRFGYPDGSPGHDPFDVTFHPDKLDDPLKWKKPRLVFVSSMGDLFHPDVPGADICRVFDVMFSADHHQYFILTKRPKRMGDRWDGEYHYSRRPMEHIWHGTSIENQTAANERLRELVKTRSAHRFISAEPLLGEIDISPWLPEISWVIAGGETGPGARACDLSWVWSLQRQCQEAVVPFFFKAWGEWVPLEYYHQLPVNTMIRDRTYTHAKVGRKAAGHLLGSKEYRQVPPELAGFFEEKA